MLGDVLDGFCTGGRPIGLSSYAWIWVGIAVIIATCSQGRRRRSGSIGLASVIPAIMIASLATGAFMLLAADIGTGHGLGFAVCLRALRGARHLPAASRGVAAPMWFGIQTHLGTLALNGTGEHLLKLFHLVCLACPVRGLAGCRHRPGHPPHQAAGRDDPPGHCPAPIRTSGQLCRCG